MMCIVGKAAVQVPAAVFQKLSHSSQILMYLLSLMMQKMSKEMMYLSQKHQMAHQIVVRRKSKR